MDVDFISINLRLPCELLSPGMSESKKAAFRNVPCSHNENEKETRR